jgi:hypothetical protein
MYDLKYYTERAKKMSYAQLAGALSDILATLPLHDYNSAYGRKLYAEFDAYTVEKVRRTRRAA